MTTSIELGRIDWTRADIQTADAAYSRAHLWGDGSTFHAETREGEPIGSITLTYNEDGFHSAERVDSKTYRLTGQDGQVWTVKRGGCSNCGG